MFSKKKKFLLLSVMVVLLIATGVLNLVLNKNIVDTGTNAQTAAQFFSSQRQDRALAREQEIIYLNSIINDPTSSADVVLNAQNKKINITNTMELEVACESLIKAKGFNDCFVITGKSLFNVVVDAATLTDAEVSKIVDVIMFKAQVDFDSVIVTPIRKA